MRTPTTHHTRFLNRIVLTFGLFFSGLLLPPLDGREDFRESIFPLLKKHCVACHGKKVAEADLNLLEWTDEQAVGQHLKDLQLFHSILKSGQMPPPDVAQPTPSERKRLVDWSGKLLRFHAEKFSGDPGPVILRRLNHAEYNYSIQDLTGIPSLDPTREFPVDGAAGEGFTNTGNALVMSPALFQKYLDAAKQVARHAMLLEDRIAFTPQVSRRDRSDAYIRKIQAFYGRYANNAGGTPVNLQGIRLDTNTGGRLPIEPYLRLILEKRNSAGRKDIALDELARSASLSPKYLNILWHQLIGPVEDPGFILALLRERMRTANADQIPQIVADIHRWQQRLWKFNTIGHIGRPGGAKSWMEPAEPLTRRREFRIPIPAQAADTKQTVTLSLASQPLTDSRQGHVKWESPRITGGGQGDLLLRDLESLVEEGEKKRQALLEKTELLLQAADVIRGKIEGKSATEAEALVDEFASSQQIALPQLKLWLNYLGIFHNGPVAVSGHYRKQLRNANNYSFVNGWGTGATPSVIANSSEQEVRIPGISRPRSICVHPSPTLYSAVGWQAPETGQYDIVAAISDQHPECGNGVEWVILHQTPTRSTKIWDGTIAKAGNSKMESRKLALQKGDLVTFYVGPSQKSHACDLTEINLYMRQRGSKKTWDLAREISPNLLKANPAADQFGNPAVWHFTKGNWDNLLSELNRRPRIPAGSQLDRWLQAESSAERNRLARMVHKTVNQPSPEIAAADRTMVEEVRRLLDPFKDERLRTGLRPDPRFGKTPQGEKRENRDLYTSTRAQLEFTIPTRLAAGREIVLTAILESDLPEEVVQLSAHLASSSPAEQIASQPLSLSQHSAAQSTVRRAFQSFRKLFPAALCYQKIVPIDEVVTLTLFYREDQPLVDLFLSDSEKRELDALWRELIFVSEEPLKKVVALEQLYQFATQDRPDLVVEFKTLFDPTRQRADAFLKRRQDAEKIHVRRSLELAARAWRRPLSQAEEKGLEEFYRSLREQELDHGSSIRLLLTRILASPAFLYRREKSNPGNGHSPVSQLELASRLSYFLWSSTPDTQLIQKAEKGLLGDPVVLNAEAERMLKSPKIRRLAIEFACQWLHLRNFDQNNDKNEKRFPEFASLKKDMYEETVVFFENMFRRNESVLDIIDADYSYANKRLVQHYGLEGVSIHAGRSDGWKSAGRGGVLGMASFLASQSGASRTSPILRGNWISETLLGEKLPRPPPDVPQLPEDVPSGLTARQLIEKHSELPQCAKCHARIDPYGFALENFDPLGRHRKTKVNTRVQLVDGTEVDGLAGLKKYLLTSRKRDFVRQFCRKLLGYSLGREVQLSDQPLLDRMLENLEKDDYRVHSAIRTILGSQPFRNVRDQDYVRPK
ncbi:MAG: DUF1592 domain-containing protein [Planctomycetota bacterium]|nr:DUF1592 domain-containing protein [Planctomycetota bacterium]